jgi:cellulose synthase/poly-beta-1,6-N-acetylglucosamine synthase-like glycosyltransferase
MGAGPGGTGAVGVVAIGRNEGERLERCLASLAGSADYLAYVDSGSSDGSVAMARARGVEVIELDMHQPFTAARARNAGLARLLQLCPDLRYVFFVDGDCEVVHGWIGEAVGFLESHPDVAVVCGRRRERHPERSIYNLLCDIEWDSAPAGETGACGGDAVIRVEAFRAVEGFRPDLICGEEPELCARLRKAGWRIWRLASDMTIHDAAMYHLAQWWRRTVRVGYGYAMFMRLDSVRHDRQWIGRYRRSRLWSLGIPALVVASSLLFGWSALWLLALYPLQVARLAIRGKRSSRENWSRAIALVLGHFAEMHGQLKYQLQRYRGTRSTLIEYK